MLSANFKPKRTAAASRGFLVTARLSCTGLDAGDRLSPDRLLHLTYVLFVASDGRKSKLNSIQFSAYRLKIKEYADWKLRNRPMQYQNIIKSQTNWERVRITSQCHNVIYLVRCRAKRELSCSFWKSTKSKYIQRAQLFPRMSSQLAGKSRHCSSGRQTHIRRWSDA